MRHILLLLALLLGTAGASAQVWTDTNTWNAQWEARYQGWVQSEWNRDFFARKTLPNGAPNPFLNLRSDCADTVYAMRIVFAAWHQLPFAAVDPTGGSRLITNRMNRFDSIQDPGERLRRFLLYIFGVLSTASLPNDTYPIALDQDSVRPGTLILTTRTNHHSWTVKEILPIGVPWLIFSSRVSATTSPLWQERQSWPNPQWVFEGNRTPQGHAGFRAFRPIDYLRRPVWEVPGYSEEQYRIPLNQWQKFATQKLAQRAESDEQLLRRLFKVACDGMQGRVGAVRDGILHLQKAPRCMDYPTYDNFSTPNRDQRVFDDLAALRTSFKEIMRANGGSRVPADFRGQLQKIFPQLDRSAKVENESMPVQQITSTSSCVIDYGKKIDLAEAKRRLFAGLMSNNPHDSIEFRWGESRGSSNLARSCQSWDPWTPNLSLAD